MITAINKNENEHTTTFNKMLSEKNYYIYVYIYSFYVEMGS